MSGRRRYANGVPLVLFPALLASTQILAAPPTGNRFPQPVPAGSTPGRVVQRPLESMSRSGRRTITPGSIDMATALHPQTLLATGYAGEKLGDPFGFPVRLRTSTKLGFKNLKWLIAIEVTNTFTLGYWGKKGMGFNWFSGL